MPTEHRAELEPVLVSASVNISGERLLSDVPGVRFALWRIQSKQTLQQAIALLTSPKAAGIGEGEVRSIYAAIFNDPTMLVPGNPSETRPVGDSEKKAAENWLTGYKNL